MESLNRILNSPYLVLNKLAVALYQDGTAAAKVRLRSRANGQHRYTKAEVKRLRQLLRAFAATLEKRAAKMEAAAAAEELEEPPLKLLEHKLLNTKQFLSRNQHETGKNYNQLYDQMRLRTQPHAATLGQLAQSLYRFSAFILEQLEASKTESKTYPFSAGRGALSHLGETKQEE